MRISSFLTMPDIGVVCLENDFTSEIRFFHSQRQAMILCRDVDPEDPSVLYFLKKVFESDISAENETLPLRIEGAIGRTIKFILESFQTNIVLECELTPQSFFLVISGEESASYALLGIQNATFVFHSREQGRRLVQENCGDVLERERSEAMREIDASYLPETSPIKELEIGGLLAYFLNAGYFLSKIHDS